MKKTNQADYANHYSSQTNQADNKKVCCKLDLFCERSEQPPHSRKNWQFSLHEKKVAPGGNRTRDLSFTGSFRLFEVWLG